METNDFGQKDKIFKIADFDDITLESSPNRMNTSSLYLASKKYLIIKVLIL